MRRQKNDGGYFNVKGDRGRLSVGAFSFVHTCRRVPFAYNSAMETAWNVCRFSISPCL